MLNASLSTGWVAAALGVALLCAGAALGLAAWNVPMPDRLTSDGQGNIYAILGDKVYRWDAQGHESLAADLNTAPSMPTDNSGMRVGADGSVYIADMSTTSVMVFGPDGRYKASLKVKARPYSMGARQWNIAVAPTAKGPIVLDSGSLAHFDAYGKPTITPVGGKLYFAQDIEQAADGSTFIADTTHGKVLHVNGTTTQTIDCLGLPDGYCYPSEVRVAPNGDVYAIVRKRWGYKGGAAAALSELAPPDIWMGRLARIDTAIGQASLVDIRFNGVALSTDSVGFQSSGAIVVSALNQGWLYRVDNPSVSTGAERMTVGELGQRSNVVDRNWRVQSLGPQLFFSLAVVLPIGLGVTGVALGRRRKSQWT
jgi:hypothetical protein